MVYFVVHSGLGHVPPVQQQQRLILPLRGDMNWTGGQSDLQDILFSFWNEWLGQENDDEDNYLGYGLLVVESVKLSDMMQLRMMTFRVHFGALMCKEFLNAN